MSENIYSGPPAINETLIETTGQIVPEELPTVDSLDTVAPQEEQAGPDQTEEQIISNEKWSKLHKIGSVALSGAKVVGKATARTVKITNVAAKKELGKQLDKSAEKKARNKAFAKQIGNIALRRAEGDLTAELPTAQNHKQTRMVRKLHNKTHELEKAIDNDELILGKSDQPLGGPRRVATFEHRRALKKEAKSEYKQGEISSFEYAKRKKVAKYATVGQLSKTQKKAKEGPQITKAAMKKFGEKLGGGLDTDAAETATSEMPTHETTRTIGLNVLDPAEVLAFRALDEAEIKNILADTALAPEEKSEEIQKLTKTTKP